MNTHIPIRGPEYKSPEWYALRTYNPDRKERPIVFGASEAAAACNQCPYSSALELYLKKRAEMDDNFSPASKFRMAAGTHLEPLILDYYEEQQDCTLERSQPMFFHPVWSFMGASLDAIAQPRDRDRNEAWSVDAKLTNWRMKDRSGDDSGKFGDEGTDQIPINYIFQGQVQMAVMGFDRCDFAVSIDNTAPLIYTVARNEELIQQIALAEAELSERIVNGDPPEPNWTHDGTVKLLHRLHGVDVGKVVTLPDEISELWTRKEDLSKTVKMMEEEIDEIKARVMWALGEAQIGRADDIEIKRTVVAESVITEKDIADFSARLGQVKRSGYSLLKGKRLG